jgi:hypothetical protein
LLEGDLTNLVSGNADELFMLISLGETAPAPFVTPLPDLVFAARRFVFVDEFVLGTWKWCDEAIKARGGMRQDKVMRNTDYLVIGQYASRDWRMLYEERTKLRDTSELIRNGHPIAIIPEDHLTAALGFAPFPVKVYDSVRLDSPVSKYYGIMGQIFEIQRASRYAVIDMPKGTEKAAEGIVHNSFLLELKRSLKDRKKPLTRWPKGDPQWFPLEWLVLPGEFPRTEIVETVPAETSNLFWKQPGTGGSWRPDNPLHDAWLAWIRNPKVHASDFCNCPGGRGKGCGVGCGQCGTCPSCHRQIDGRIFNSHVQACVSASQCSEPSTTA